MALLHAIASTASGEMLVLAILVLDFDGLLVVFIRGYPDKTECPRMQVGLRLSSLPSPRMIFVAKRMGRRTLSNNVDADQLSSSNLQVQCCCVLAGISHMVDRASQS